jgi:kumamolisin
MQKINTGAADAAPVSREEFGKRFGASAADVAKTEAFAKRMASTVVRADAGSRSVVLSGTIAQFSAAFGVKLERFDHHAIGEYRGRSGPVNVPDGHEGHGHRRAGSRQPPAGAPAFPLPAADQGQRAANPARHTRRSISRGSTISPAATAAASAWASSNWAGDTTKAI